jgi:hypothetical protein
VTSQPGKPLIDSEFPQEQEPWTRSADSPTDAPGDDHVGRDVVIVAAEDTVVVSDLETGDLETGVDAPPQGDAIVPAQQRDGDIGRQWHDIQALFVDDPRGSVRKAAAAADAAVDQLVATLHQRKAALVPSDETPRQPGETEQLREALRSYRIFCQHVADVGHQLSEPVTPAR